MPASALGQPGVPKAESAGDIQFVERLARHGRRRSAGRAAPRVGLQALIETAAGPRPRARDRRHACPRLEALIVGYADLGASLGRPAEAATIRVTAGTTCARPYWSPRATPASRRSTGPTWTSADEEGFAPRPERARPRLRRQVGAAPEPDRAAQRALLPDPGGVRPRPARARGAGGSRASRGAVQPRTAR